MQWDYKKIRKNSWDTAFHKGGRAWLMLAAVGFLFSFIGIAHSSQTGFIDAIDKYIWANDTFLPDNIAILKEYIVETPLVKNIPFITSDLALAVIDILSESVTWVIWLFAANIAYFQRNPGEVIANMLIAAGVTAAVGFFLKNVAIIGRNRYVMENRFGREVSFRRLFAPFHMKTLWNLVKVMFCYHLTISLWSLTVVGGPYKRYQYYFIPYILAENPAVSWREAKRLSCSMTRGFKWKMFLTQLSYWYMWLLELVPFAGLCFAVPLSMQLDVEMYFAARALFGGDRTLLAEPVFSGCAYTELADRENAGAPDYVLADLSLGRPQRAGKFCDYSVTDFIFMFFVFCLIGWLWECGQHIIRDHELVNRGTMYGPWIPIYGFGGVIMVFLLNRFKKNKGKVFVSGVALCAVLEYITSFILDFMFDSSYWDYKSEFMNINGRICLSGLLAFGIGGMAAIYLVGPAIRNYVERFSRRSQIIISVILCAAFLADFVYCMIFGFNSGAGVGGKM
ncbi:MAG: hypothetical protein K2P87_02465 [Lachnospiraceae bacterium]|nr:hypothetical protein [Lachnospiraceae bacterium]